MCLAAWRDVCSEVCESLQSWYLVSSIFVQAADYPMSWTKPASPALNLLFFPACCLLLSSHDEYYPVIVDGLSVFTLHNLSVKELFISEINWTQTARKTERQTDSKVSQRDLSQTETHSGVCNMITEPVERDGRGWMRARDGDVGDSIHGPQPV